MPPWKFQHQIPETNEEVNCLQLSFNLLRRVRARQRKKPPVTSPRSSAFIHWLRPFGYLSFFSSPPPLLRGDEKKCILGNTRQKRVRTSLPLLRTKNRPAKDNSEEIRKKNKKEEAANQRQGLAILMPTKRSCHKYCFQTVEPK